MYPTELITNAAIAIDAENRALLLQDSCMQFVAALVKSASSAFVSVLLPLSESSSRHFSRHFAPHLMALKQIHDTAWLGLKTLDIFSAGYELTFKLFKRQIKSLQTGPQAGDWSGS